MLQNMVCYKMSERQCCLGKHATQVTFSFSSIMVFSSCPLLPGENWRKCFIPAREGLKEMFYSHGKSFAPLLSLKIMHGSGPWRRGSIKLVLTWVDAKLFLLVIRAVLSINQYMLYNVKIIVNFQWGPIYWPIYGQYVSVIMLDSG